MLGDRLVFGNRFCASERVPQNCRLGRERQRVLIGASLSLRPLRDDTGHVIHQAMHPAFTMMAMRRAFGYHK